MESGNGASKTGSFGYTSPEGKRISLTYGWFLSFNLSLIFFRTEGFGIKLLLYLLMQWPMNSDSAQLGKKTIIKIS